MITPGYVQLLARYNSEMNRRFYAAAATLDAAQRQENCGAFFGSIHATLAHIQWADRMWMSRFAGWAKPVVAFPGTTGWLAQYEELAAARVAIDGDIQAWADGLDQGWLEGELTWYSGSAQREMTKARWPLVVHLFNHSTHHRGQVHAMLTRFGAATGATDLGFVV